MVHLRNGIFVRNEEKLTALLAYSSFRQVATSGFRENFRVTSSSSRIRQDVLKWGVNTQWLRIKHSTAAQHSKWTVYDVTRSVGRNM